MQTAACQLGEPGDERCYGFGGLGTDYQGRLDLLSGKLACKELRDKRSVFLLLEQELQSCSREGRIDW